MTARRWKVLCLVLWAVLLLASLPLPALVHESEKVWVYEGYRAALTAALLPVVWSQPFGGFLVLLYPLLFATLFGVVRGRTFAVGTAVAHVATMLLWGFVAPEEPRANVFGGTDPGGDLGVGYWVWIASGMCLVLGSLAPPRSRRHAAWVGAGAAYAVLVAAAGFGSGIRADRARQAAEAEARRVLEYKLKRVQEPHEAPAP